MPELKVPYRHVSTIRIITVILTRSQWAGTPQLHRRTLVATVLKNVKTDIQTAQENRHRRSAM